MFIDSQTSALLSLALDAASMRQQAIAQNIANANTPGYQRISVSFESRIAALVDTNGHVNLPSLNSLAQYQPRLELASMPNYATDAERNVAIDQELAQLSENTVHHQALLKMVTKHYALISSAINEGKR